MTSTLSSRPKPFKSQYTFEERSAESTRVFKRYATITAENPIQRVPVIVEILPSAPPTCPVSPQVKFMVPIDLTFGQLLFVIRKSINTPNEKKKYKPTRTITHEEALFLFVNGRLIALTQEVREVYNQHKDTDGFLYVHYTTENTFGSTFTH